MIERSGDDNAGWAVAIIILLAVVAVGGFLWLRYYRAPAAAPAPGANINVTLPSAPSANPGTGGGATGGTGGATPAPAQ
jgi:hypothetical protein